MGCEAAQNRPPWLYLVHRVSLFHTSEASPSVHISRFCPEGVGANLFAMAAKRPKTGHLGCIWCTEAAGFGAGSRQFADKRSVARSALITPIRTWRLPDRPSSARRPVQPCSLRLPR
ncbi:hypothetical protein CU668_10645 [Pseudomonas syringae pv. actinidifoliorum]|nr:hypothetical protein [Pseudomonas syringae pv. actinidifoliorum]